MGIINTDDTSIQIDMKYYCMDCEKQFNTPKLIDDNEDYEHCPHCESDNFKFNKK